MSCQMAGVQKPTPTASDVETMAESSGDSEAEEHSPKSKDHGPRFLSGLQLSHLDWKALSRGQEWRNELLLRGLPQQLCDKNRLEAFLAANGFGKAASRVCIFRGKGGKLGAAVVRATSTDSAARLAKFFHGRQLAGSNTPVAVSYAAGTGPNSLLRVKGNVGEPMRVQSNLCAPLQKQPWRLPAGVRLPPGLENVLRL
uniref:Uncharacterized protein n=1 Tax=Alexandrium monilatum TaxID=311494 RepID=A0A7S4RLL0_9DINO